MRNENSQIIVDINCDDDEPFEPERLISLAKSVCNRYSVNAANISIAIVDDNAIAKINEDFLNHQGATDVISFDLTGDYGVKEFEIVINSQQAERQALERGHSTQAEIALYLTHGLLHNLGFDDQDEKQAKKMHETEDMILKEEGFGIVYAGKHRTE